MYAIVFVLSLLIVVALAVTLPWPSGENNEYSILNRPHVSRETSHRAPRQAHPDICRMARNESDRLVLFEHPPSQQDVPRGASVMRIRREEGFDIVHESDWHGERAVQMARVLNREVTDRSMIREGYVVLDLDDMPNHGSSGLCFSRRSDSDGPMVPDSYHMNDYAGQMLRARDASKRTTWDTKHDRVVFYGASTGAPPPNNRRALWCEWSLTRRNISDLRITSCVQGYPVRNEWRGERMSIDDQLKSRFILSVMGNAAAWDRPPWVMASNSILLMDEHTPPMWYYPLLAEHTAVEWVIPENIEGIMLRLNNNDAERILLNARQQEFSKNMLSQAALNDFWNAFWKIE